MKLTTLTIVVGPGVLLFAAKFMIEPMWLSEWSLPACIALGVVIGGFGALSARILESHD